MPIAVCMVEVGRSRALRHSEALRPTSPSTVMISAQPAKNPRLRRRGDCGIERGQRETGSAAEQDVIDHRQRRVPLAQEAQAGIDHRGADEQHEGEEGADVAQHDGKVDRQAAGQGDQHRFPVKQMRDAIQEHDAHESGQGDHLARQPRRAPHRRRAPGALGMAEVEERSGQSADQQHQCEQAAVAVEPVVLHRQQIEQRIGLLREQGEEQPLAGADQGGEEDDGKGGFHLYNLKESESLPPLRGKVRMGVGRWLGHRRRVCKISTPTLALPLQGGGDS